MRKKSCSDQFYLMKQRCKYLLLNQKQNCVCETYYHTLKLLVRAYWQNPLNVLSQCRRLPQNYFRPGDNNPKQNLFHQSSASCFCMPCLVTNFVRMHLGNTGTNQ